MQHIGQPVIVLAIDTGRVDFAISHAVHLGQGAFSQLSSSISCPPVMLMLSLLAIKKHLPSAEVMR